MRAPLKANYNGQDQIVKAELLTSSRRVRSVMHITCMAQKVAKERGLVDGNILPLAKLAQGSVLHGAGISKLDLRCSSRHFVLLSEYTM